MTGVWMVLMVACGPKQVPVPAPEVAAPEPPATDPVEAAYITGVADARFATPAEVSTQLIALVPDNPALQWDQDGRVLMSTWTKAQYYSDPAYVPGYAYPLYGESWFSTAGQVQAICSAQGLEGEALDLRVEQALGLPPGGSYDSFADVWVHPSDLIRPCADPAVDTTTCAVAAPMSSSGPDDVAWDCAAPEGEHQQWMCNTWASRYGVSEPLARYPWTALGYTYDWHDLDEPEGVSEFVAEGGTEVVFERLRSTAEYCGSEGTGQ